MCEINVFSLQARDSHMKGKARIMILLQILTTKFFYFHEGLTNHETKLMTPNLQRTKIERHRLTLAVHT